MDFVRADDNKGGLLDRELTEEKFFEQFAALEENLALLQTHMRDMSETVKLFGSLATRIRRSVCPTARAREETRPVPRCVTRNR